LIFAVVSGICTKAMLKSSASTYLQINELMMNIVHYYQDVEFQTLLATYPPLLPSLPLLPYSALNMKLNVPTFTARQKHIILSLYHQHSNVLYQQSLQPFRILAALLLTMATEGLIGASVLLVFVVVFCRTPGALVDQCEVRLGIPIGIGLFCALLLAHLQELSSNIWSFIRKCFRL